MYEGERSHNEEQGNFMESSIHYSPIWELRTICSPAERNGVGDTKKENLAYYGLDALISGSDEINGATIFL